MDKHIKTVDLRALVPQNFLIIPHDLIVPLIVY